jgi:DNA (cytosine-5)-methyltransferase 1
MKKNKLTVGGLFSGVGGIELGFIQNGFEVLWSNEIDKEAAKTFQLNFEHKLILDDIKNINGKDLEVVDVLVGGFPCQAFSIAGYRKGFDDERGNLFFEIVRLIKELKQKPKALLLENVKNFYTHDKGNTFKVVVEHLEALGYCVFSKVMNTSSYTNIPQNRERTFIICFLDGANADIYQNSSMSKTFKTLFPPTPINKTEHIKKYLENGKVDDKYYYGKEKYMYKELSDSIKSEDTVYQWRRHYVRENKSDVCPTLTANMGTGGHNVPLIKDSFGFRKLTPRECFNLQGFPNNYKLPNDISNSHLYKQSGNSVTVGMINLLASLIKEAIVKIEN